MVTTSNDVVINARKEGNLIESSTMGIQPVYQMPTGNCGYGDGMYGGGWMWIILILLFAGRGFGWGNGQDIQDNFISSEFIKRDVFNTNQNVSNTGCQTQRDVLENRFTNQQCCCETQKEILENRYQNALSFKDQLYAQQQCCCETNRNIDSVIA